MIINAIDVLVGNAQLILARVSDVNGNPITSVTVTGVTDNISTGPVSLSLTDGTTLDGTWQGSWIMPQDTYCTGYQLDVSATSGSGTNSVVLSIQ